MPDFTKDSSWGLVEPAKSKNGNIRNYIILSVITLCESPEIWTGQNNSPIFWHVVHTNSIVERYGKRIKVLHGCLLEGWPNRA